MITSKVLLIPHGFQAHYELGFANGLAENGIKALLLGSDTTLREKLNSNVDFRNIRGAQTSTRSPWQKLKNMVSYHLKLLFTIIQNRASTAFVIGLTHPELLVGIVEGALLRLLTTRYGLVVHNILPHDKHTTAMKYVYRVIYRLPHLLMVHTPETSKALVAEFGIDEKKIVVVEHGSNDAVSRSQLAPPEARAKLGFLLDDPVLLFFGTVAPYKGLDILLDALEDHPRVKLLVAGRCPGSSYGNAVRDRLKSLVQSNRAVWRDGYLDDSEIGTVFAAADAVVLPYQHIDQSGVLLLALTLGTPFIATNVGSFSRFVTPATGVLVDTPTRFDVSKGIEKFYAARGTAIQPDAVRAMGESLAWRTTIKPLLAHLAP